MSRGIRFKLATLLLLSLFFRLVWASCLETGNDEGYHYLYTVHPDWSYFDHPPMLMLVARLGMAAFGGWIHPLSLRIGFILMFVGSTWIMFRWTSRWFGESAGYHAALALNLSAYYTAAAGSFVLPDGPFLFFALLTMWRVSEALVGVPDRVLPWVWVGLACAGAMLSKYHAVFLPMGTLVYVVATPSARRVLKTPGPYIAASVALLGAAPALYWNSQHDWISFLFQGSRAVGSGFRLVGLVPMFVGPIAYLLPWIWFSLITVLWRKIGDFRSSCGIERLLVCLAVCPLFLFGAVSVFRNVMPHWPLIGFIPLYPLVGASWAEYAALEPARVRRNIAWMSGALFVIAAAFGTQARFGLVTFAGKDPTAEISGWESVAADLDARGILSRPNTFLFTNRWFNSGQLAFAVRNRIPVVCYNATDARGFAFWSRPEEWVGKDGVLIDLDDTVDSSGDYERYFQTVTSVASTSMQRSGRPFRKVRIYLCKNQSRPFQQRQAIDGDGFVQPCRAAFAFAEDR